VAARPSSRRARRALGWVVLGFAVAAVQAVWSLSIPLMAAPDEPSHVVYAAAVARGEWSGTLGAAPSDGSAPGAATTVELPSDYAAAILLPNCFAFHPDAPASCQQALPAPNGGSVAVKTFAGQYPPLYYLAVGWPSRFLSAGPSTVAMRLLSALISAALLTWGLFRLRTTTLARPWIWGTLAAVTPMTLFLGATVNPQALEISSAFAFWAACLALARSDDPSGPRGAVAQAAVTGALLVNARTSGPVWALTIMVVALVIAPQGRLRLLWRLRAMRWALGAAVVSGLLAAAWLITHGAVVSGDHQYPGYSRPLTVAHVVLLNSYAYLRQMIGDYGWLDAPSPTLTLVVWIGLLAALIIAAFVVGRSRRARAALLLSIVAVVAMPVVLQIPTAVDTGIIWQGRYTLPLAVGVPMVAAIVLSTKPRTLHVPGRRLMPWLVVAAAAGHVAAFWWAMRRYSVGLTGPLVSWSPAWSPFLGYLGTVSLYAALVIVTLAAARYALRPTPSAATPSVDPGTFDGQRRLEPLA